MVSYSFHRICREGSKVTVQRLLCVRSEEETPLIVSAVAGVTGVPVKLCTTQKCASGVTFQLSFREQMLTVVSAQLLRVCPYALYLVFFKFLFSVLLLSLVGKPSL